MHPPSNQIAVTVSNGRVEARFRMNARNMLLHMSHGRHMWNLLRNDTQPEEKNSLFRDSVTVENARNMLHDVAVTIITSKDTTARSENGVSVMTQGIATKWYWHPMLGAELHAFPVSGQSVVQMTRAQFLAIRAVKCHLHGEVGPNLQESIRDAGGWDKVWTVLHEINRSYAENQIKRRLGLP